MLINYTSRRRQRGEGKKKPITRMKAKRNVWLYSQLQTQAGEGRGKKKEINNEGIILEN